MNIRPPASFRRGLDFRELSHTEGRNIYRFQTSRQVRFPCGMSRFLASIGHAITFHDQTGREWLRMDGAGFRVPAGYAWNGCSPKRWVWPLGWIGTPDFACTLAASLLHDTLYQFHATPDFPLTRSESDEILFDLIELSGGPPWIAEIYHAAVDSFGSWDGKTNGCYSILTL